MSYPITHAVFLGRQPASLDFPEDGGLSVTVPEPPTVSIPEGMGHICIGQGDEGSFIVSIPAGLSVSIPLDKIEGVLINDALTKLPSRKPPRCILKFPSGGKIIVPRPVKGSHVKIDGLGASMDPLPNE